MNVNRSRGAGRLVKFGAALLMVGAAFAVPAFSAGEETAVVARVNGKDITNAEVALAMEIFGDQIEALAEADRRRIVIDALVDMHVLADAATKEGLADTEIHKRRLAFLSTQALRNSYIEERVRKAVTEADLKARYDKDVAAYTPPEEVRARHILVETEDEAKKILADLAAGKDFAALAKEKSTDPGSKENGGDLGFFTKDQMVPEFEAEAFALKPGELSKAPVKSEFGFHIIKVEEKRTQPVPTLEDVREDVTQVVQREKFQEILKQLKEKAKIERIEKPVSPEEAGKGADGADGQDGADGADGQDGGVQPK